MIPATAIPIMKAPFVWGGPIASGLGLTPRRRQEVPSDQRSAAGLGSAAPRVQDLRRLTQGGSMADQIRRVDYCYVEVPDKPGEGVRVLTALKESGVDLLNFTAFPGAGGKTQIDVVAPDAEALARAAKKAGLTLSARKQAFFIQGQN